MNRLLSLLGLLVAAAKLTAADPPDARAALNKYYTDPIPYHYGRTPAVAPWKMLVGRLGSKDAGERRAGADSVQKLLALALADERSGKWPLPTPFWNGRADGPASELRGEVAAKLRDTPPSVELLPVLRWFLENEPDERYFWYVNAVVGKVDGEAADALRAELATKPHSSQTVVVEMFKQVAARNKMLPADTVAALCHHHRADVRSAARAAHERQGGKDPGPFDPVKAVRSDPVAKVVARLTELLPDLPPADAELVTVTVRYLDDKSIERQKYEWRGWREKSADGVVRILTTRGRVESFPDKEKSRLNVEELLPDGGRQYTPLTLTTAVTVAPIEPSVLVKMIGAARAKENDGFRIVRSEFDGSTLFQAMLGVWLYRAGQYADAARVLLPALGALDRDEHFVRVVSLRAGEIVGQKMLVAFIGDRDYPTALKHAERINSLYPNTQFSGYAKGLTEQLPKRGDDFTRLKLPTPAEWAELTKKLSRDEQIDFLCERMRLLNCFQSGQPGGYSLYDKQFAEPCGMSENAAWGVYKGKTEVINPFAELLGHYDPNEAKGMSLTRKDIPRLSKYLRDDWYMPTVGFHRDFFPDRHLASTRPLFVDAINRLAGKDVCKIDEWANLTPAEIDKRIEQINKAAE